MSPSINSKSRSLILADQAMGLSMSPKCSPLDMDSNLSPATLASTTPTAKNTSSPTAQSHSNATADISSAETFRAGNAPLEIARSNVVIANSLTVGAHVSAMQWGITRALPHTLPERRDALNEIRARHDATCPLCCGAGNYTHTVLGEGNPEAELVFVGEAPGDKEDATGKPFQGDSGAKLDEMIKAMGFSREQVFITNVLKIRPQLNQTPTKEQIEQCAGFLAEQLVVIRPKVIVPMGGPAAKQLLRKDEGISLLRGKWGVWVAPSGCQVMPIPVMPTFHPAYLLRNYTLETRALMWSDMKLVMTKLSAK